MTTEEIYERLQIIVESYKLATKNSFEQETKNGKKLYRSICNILDELSTEQPSDELFDDDEYFSAPDYENRDKYEDIVKSETDNDDLFVKKPKFTMDDILGDDDDSIW